MTIDEFLHSRISQYGNAKFFRSNEVTVGYVLNAIKNGTYKTSIQHIRYLIAHGEKEQAGMIKSQLPAVTFSALFGERRLVEYCKKYTSILVIDIDKLNADELAKVGETLRNDDYVISYWKSPSGNGWKGLVVLDFPEDKVYYSLSYLHREAFGQVAAYFKSRYNILLDGSGKDIPRLCFMSYDKNLEIKSSITPYPVKLDLLNFEQNEGNTEEIDTAVKQMKYTISSYVPIGWNKLDGQTVCNPHIRQEKDLLHSIYKYLKKNNCSITSTYEDWVKVAFAIANTFHSVYGRNMFMKLCELDGAKHDVEKSEKLIYSAYNTSRKLCSFRTIVYFAEKKGFKYNP